MTKEQELYQKLEAIIDEYEPLSNPLANDAGGSRLWTDIINKLTEAFNILRRDKRIYGW